MATKGPRRPSKPSVASAPVAAPAIVVDAPATAPEAEFTAPAAEPQSIIPAAALVAPAPVIEAAAEAAPIPAAETAPNVSKEDTTMATQFENPTTKATAYFGDINERSKVAVEKSTKMVEEMTDFAKGNVEALVESGRIAAKGFETLGQEAAEFSRKSFESATSAMKSFASVKSPTEFFKLHSDYVRQSFDLMVAETSKNTETVLKLAGDAAQPLSNRFAVAAEKVKTAA